MKKLINYECQRDRHPQDVCSPRWTSRPERLSYYYWFERLRANTEAIKTFEGLWLVTKPKSYFSRNLIFQLNWDSSIYRLPRHKKHKQCAPLHSSNDPCVLHLTRASHPMTHLLHKMQRPPLYGKISSVGGQNSRQYCWCQSHLKETKFFLDTYMYKFQIATFFPSISFFWVESLWSVVLTVL